MSKLTNNFHNKARILGLIVPSVVLTAAVGLSTGCGPTWEPGPLVSTPATAAGAGLQDRYEDPGITPVAPLTHQPTLYGAGFLNANLYPDRNGIHDNNWNTDVTDLAGPTFSDTLSVATIDWMPPGLLSFNACPSVMTTTDDNAISVCIDPFATRIRLVDPDTMTLLDTVELPPKVITGLTAGENDASGGGYLHLTDTGELLVAPADKTIRTYNVTGGSISLTNSFNLAPFIPADHNITDAVPDFNNLMWFTTGQGAIGYIDDIWGSPSVVVLQVSSLTGSSAEEMQNQIGIDTSGVYFTTYNEVNNDGHFWKVAANGALDGIDVLHSTTYTIGTVSGTVSPGSGTTPTLFGTSSDLVSIADNDPTGINMLVFDRSDLSLVCKYPMFAGVANAAIENSAIGYANSIAAQSSGGWDGFNGNPLILNEAYEKFTVDTSTPSGAAGESGTCTQNWLNTTLLASATPTLSTETGLVYTLSFKPGTGGAAAAYMTAVDWVTGDAYFEQWIGNGWDFDTILTGGTLTTTGTYVLPNRQGMMSISITP